MMTRRDFIRASGCLVGAGAVAMGQATVGTQPVVMTVRGPVPAGDLGLTLPHEHILVDFVGADQTGSHRYSRDEVFEVALPHLKRAHELGARALVECTPAYLARDPILMRRLSEAADIHILTNTGYYGAANDKFVPKHASDESAEQLAERWIAEWRDGIEGTGIRPGFIKTAVDNGPLSDIDAKLVRAAALTHLATGLPIASHTTDATAIRGELDILREEGVEGRSFIWVHAQAVPDEALHLEAAGFGAWVEFDGIAPETVEQHVQLVGAMHEHGLLDHVLVSHDAGWYNVGEPGGGTYRSYETLFTQLLPALREAGFTEDEIQQLTVANPRQAFGFRDAGA